MTLTRAVAKNRYLEQWNRALAVLNMPLPERGYRPVGGRCRHGIERGAESSYHTGQSLPVCAVCAMPPAQPVTGPVAPTWHSAQPTDHERIPTYRKVRGVAPSAIQDAYIGMMLREEELARPLAADEAAYLADHGVTISREARHAVPRWVYRLSDDEREHDARALEWATDRVAIRVPPDSGSDSREARQLARDAYNVTRGPVEHDAPEWVANGDLFARWNAITTATASLPPVVTDTHAVRATYRDDAAPFPGRPGRRRAKVLTSDHIMHATRDPQRRAHWVARLESVATHLLAATGTRQPAPDVYDRSAGRWHSRPDSVAYRGQPARVETTVIYRTEPTRDARGVLTYRTEARRPIATQVPRGKRRRATVLAWQGHQRVTVTSDAAREATRAERRAERKAQGATGKGGRVATPWSASARSLPRIVDRATREDATYAARVEVLEQSLRTDGAVTFSDGTHLVVLASGTECVRSSADGSEQLTGAMTLREGARRAALAYR